MKALYGIEPDLCISNPDILVWSNKDVILPKYFYNQLVYLTCLLYTSDAADDMQCVDLGGRRILKNKKLINE